MTSETLAGIVGIILSLGFAYIPGLKDWFDGQESTHKALIMGLLLVGATVVIFGASCGGLGSWGITCDQNGAIALLEILIAALLANQSTFLIAVRSVKRAQALERLTSTT